MRSGLHLGLLVLLLAAPAQAAPLSLEDCIRIGLLGNPELRGARSEVEAAEAARRAVRGAFGPKLRFEASVLRWDGSLEASFGSIPGVPISVPPFEVRSAVTTTSSFTLLQPVTPLWTILEAYRAQRSGRDASMLRERATRRDLVFQISEAYYRTLQAMSLAEVAASSVAQLEGQVTRARAFLAHGVVGENDLLRAELGLAAARQRLIQARGQVTLARGRLRQVMGVTGEVVARPLPVPPSPAAPSPGDAERRALAQRLELRELGARIDQSRAGVRAAWSRMLPQVALIASYQHTTGSSFQPADAGFVGLSASWDIWEWGQSYYATREAHARKQGALSARDRLRDAIRLEARAAQVAETTAAEALQLARKVVTQAEENFRLERKRYEAQSTTSFDVVDADTQLTAARAQLQTAQYDHLIARAALARATGDLDLSDARAAGR